MEGEGTRRPRRVSARQQSASEGVISRRESTGPPVDASRIHRDQIKSEIGNQKKSIYLNALDFVNVSDGDIEYLFVTDRIRKMHKEGLFLPPLSHRRSAKQITDYFSLGIRDKKRIRDDSANWTITRAHNDSLIWDCHNQAWIEPKEEPAPARIAHRPAQQTPCQGITLGNLRAIIISNEARACRLRLGFKHTVREGWTTRSKVSHPNNDRWSYTPPVVGMLENVNTSEPRWRVEESGAKADQFENHSIRAINCVGALLRLGKQLCAECEANKRAIIARFDSNVDIRENFDPKTKHTILERAPSLQKYVLEHHRRQSKIKGLRLARRDKVIGQLLESTGIDVRINGQSDSVFNQKNEENVKQFLSKNVGKDSIAAYAFSKAVKAHKLAKEKGVTAIRHCPLMIRLGATVLRAMGRKGGLYNLVAKICGLPSDRTIRRYEVSSSNEPDGVMHHNCVMAQDLHRQKNPNVGRHHYSRHSILALDSMHTKGRFGVSRNTNELVAVAADAFEDNVIANECKILDSNDSDDEEAKMEIPGISKHFLVFISTTWSSKGKIQFLAARYGLPTINEKNLSRMIETVITSLAFYGFIVDTIAGDGASENRSSWKSLATITAHDILSDVFSTDELQDLPLDFKIAFPHPSKIYRDTVKVIIGGEMPHWGKKFRNAFDNKSRALVFRGKIMSLKMIYEIWQASGDACVRGGSYLRKYRFTHDHFKLDSYLKMRVFLALQITSRTCIKMIGDVCGDENTEYEIEDYEPMIELFGKIDRLVDIMNGNGFKGKNRDVELINQPKHRHVFELFDILRVFEEWKTESGGFTKKYITKQTYEDLVWMIFGVAAHAALYLKTDGSNTMHQGRSGTDVCEHFFAMIRYINSNPTMQQAREGASKVSSGIGMESHKFSTESKTNSGTADDVTPADMLAPINKKQKFE